MKLEKFRGAGRRGRAMAPAVRAGEAARIRGSRTGVASMGGGLFCHSAALGYLDGEHGSASDIGKFQQMHF